jgi:hypothetical protein
MPVNSCTIDKSIDDEFLIKKYHIPEDGDFPEALSLARRLEKASQAMTRLEQTEKKLSNGITRLEEDNKILLAQQTDLIESSEKNLQALQNLGKSSSEMREITSNIASVVSNCANRIFNPVRSGFYFLTGNREPAVVLPRENQLAIEDNPENTTSITDPTNRALGDEKKNFASLLMFFAVSGGLYFLHTGERRS